MNKRWFAVILTVGLLLCLVPMSAFALSSDCITDSDGNILGWEDLTDSDPVDMVWEQAPEPASTASSTPTQAHPPTETNDVQNSVAADSSEVQMTSAESEFNTDELYADDMIPDLYAVSAVDDAASTTEPAVCEIGDTTYKSLQEAIDKASPNDQIDLLQDITLETGLTFDSKTLTISGGGTRTLTLKNLGMYATNLSDITFKDLTLIIEAHTNPSSSGGTANLFSNSNLRLNNVNMTLRPNANCGSSMYLHKESNLYLNGSQVVVEAVNGNIVDGIFADISEYSGLNRKVELNSSSLEVTGCSYTGLMLDHVDITLSSSDVVLTGNGLLDKDGGYGLACYNGKLKMESSILKATGNTGRWFGCGVFVYELDVDGDSILIASDNGVGGLGVGGEGYIHSGAKVICDGNGIDDPGGAGGLYVYAEHARSTYEGGLTIEDGATVSLCNNLGLSGIQNSWILIIKSGANVFVDNNASDGIYNSYDARLTIEGGAHVSISGNGEHGIENVPQGSMGLGDFVIKSGANVTINNNKLSGIFNRNIFTVKPGANLEIKENASSGIINDFDATLNLGSGVVQCNNATTTTYYWNNGWIAVGQKGGGIRNLGIANLSDDVQLYNNHAFTAGDDIYNSADATITFGDTGEGWALDGAPDCYDDIDGWYDDSENARWDAHAEDEADLHTVLADSGTFYSALALKAAHGFHPTGTLIISKKIDGALEPDDCGTDFNFVLTLADSSITTADAKKYGVVFEDGKAAFTLKDTESITIANLPAGMSYTLAEQSKGGWRLAWVDGDAEGVVPRRKTAAITFINEKLPATGSLVISKQVTGDLNAEDADTVFHFVLTLDDDTLTTADAEEYGVAFESGWASFTLKGGESITIGSLPAGVGYTIAETRQDGWTLQSVSGETTGVIPQNGTVEIAFVNQKDDGFIPVAPVDPIEPVLPVDPVEPVEPAEPAEPVTPEVPETPAQDEAPAPSQTPEAPAKADASVSTLPQTGTPGWMAMALLSFGCVLLACGWFLTRKQRRMK